MSLIVKTNIEKLYEFVCSKKCITKLFMIRDTDTIKKYDDGKKIVFQRVYNHTDLHLIKTIEIPKNVIELIENNLSKVEILLETTHEIIKQTDDCFIVKYSSVILKPEYLQTIVGKTKIILYVQFKVNTNNPNYTVIHYNKKLLNSNDVDDDSLIIDSSQNDIITNIYQQEKLHINENILALSEAILGHKFMHEFVLPMIDSLFVTAFSILQDVYSLRLIKYMSKKNIDVYKKK